MKIALAFVSTSTFLVSSLVYLATGNVAAATYLMVGACYFAIREGQAK